GVVGRGIQGLAVERRLPHDGAVQVDERRRAGLRAAEPDHGGGTEGVLARGEVQVDRVWLDVEQPCPFPRLVAREVACHMNSLVGLFARSPMSTNRRRRSPCATGDAAFTRTGIGMPVPPLWR